MTVSIAGESDLRGPENHLRDVVALSTLPAIWLGAEPPRVAESLAAALYTTVGADLVYVCLDCSDENMFDAAQVGRSETSLPLAEGLRPVILEWARTHDPDELMPLPDGPGGGPLLLSVRPLGLSAECGAIAAGFPEGSPPGAFQHLLLNVGATQATTAVQNIRLLRSLRQNIAEREQSEARERQVHEELETLHKVSRSLAGELDLEKLLQGFTDAATRLSGARFGAFFYNAEDQSGESYVLYTLSGAPREAFETFGLPRNTAIFEPTFRGTGTVRLEDVQKDPRYGRSAPHYGMPKGHLPVRSYLAVPVISRSRNVLGGLFLGHPEPAMFTDRSERLVAGIAAYAAVAIDNARLFGQAQNEIAERERAVGTQRLLIGELNHRVKNTLATVQAIAQQTLRNADNPDQFVDSFSGRVQALARVHNVLTQSNWQATNLKALIREQLLAGMLDETRLITSGPDVDLQPQMMQHFAMVLHELGTNSQKYGAMSRPGGSVVLSWTLESGTLFLRWAETGCSGVGLPAKKGFGSRLIEQSSRSHGGSARMGLGDGGIVWEIELPLPEETGTAGASSAATWPAKGSAGAWPNGGAESATPPLAGKRVLVVEDEPLVGFDLVDSLTAAGLEAVGPAATIEDALGMLREGSFDCALVDANLNGHPVEEVAAALTLRNVPFAFVTGYSRESLPEAFRNVPLVSKPWGPFQLMETVRQLLSLRKEPVEATVATATADARPQPPVSVRREAGSGNGNQPLPAEQEGR